MLRSFVTHRWIAGQLRTASTVGDNILDSVKRNVNNGTLREADGRAILHILLAAGGESTTSLLDNAVRILADDPALQQTLHTQPELIPTIMEDVMRLASPFSHNLRCATRHRQSVM